MRVLSPRTSLLIGAPVVPATVASLDPMHAWRGVARGGKSGKRRGSAERLLCGFRCKKRLKKDAVFFSAAIEERGRVRLVVRLCELAEQRQS